MSIKTRQILDKELQHLQDELLALASMVENAITESVEILKRRDMDGSRRLIAQDRLINEKRFAIEDEALVLIATQQPIATDLRVIAAMLDIAHELERIGDYAKGIAKINLLIGEEPLIKPLIDVPAMATRARAMLHEALEAFAQRDAEMVWMPCTIRSIVS
jgi:phosphate transport system protein